MSKTSTRTREQIAAEKITKTYGKGETAFSALKGVDLNIKLLA